jgi:hypothetical protein
MDVVDVLDPNLINVQDFLYLNIFYFKIGVVLVVQLTIIKYQQVHGVNISTIHIKYVLHNILFKAVHVWKVCNYIKKLVIKSFLLKLFKNLITQGVRVAIQHLNHALVIYKHNAQNVLHIYFYTMVLAIRMDNVLLKLFKIKKIGNANIVTNHAIHVLGC